MLPITDGIQLSALGVLLVPLLVAAGLCLLHRLDRRDRRE